MQEHEKSTVRVVKLSDFPASEIDSVVQLIVQKLNQYPDMFFGFFKKNYNDPDYEYYFLQVDGEYIPALMVCYRTDEFPEGECINLWIGDEYRRRGYGKLMVNTVEMVYVVPASYSVSQAFWYALGYREGYWEGAKLQGAWYRDSPSISVGPS